MVEEVDAYDFLVAAPKHHRFASMSKVSVQHVASEPVITVSKSRYRWYNAYVGGFLSVHNNSFEFAEEHDSAHGVIASVEAGRGVAIVYDVMAATMVDRVVVRPLTPNPAPAPLMLFYREEAKSPLLDTFIDAARSTKASLSHFSS
jgi:DNA-binding transcriptional LysR family regulator